MYYGWQDIRGYDSIIPRQYVDLLNRVADQSGELLFNRIAPIYASASAANRHNPYAALENPLLDLLGVKYILSELVVPNSNTCGRFMKTTPFEYTRIWRSSPALS